jgi:hypothetical protein
VFDEGDTCLVRFMFSLIARVVFYSRGVNSTSESERQLQMFV